MQKMPVIKGDRKEGWTTMDRRLDHQGRWRHKTVAFRVSQEESEQIDRMVRLCSDGGNSDTTIRVAEFPSRENSGKAIVIGDPSFEWKNSNEESNSIHNNLTKLATNTISYLIGQSNNK